MPQKFCVPLDLMVCYRFSKVFVNWRIRRTHKEVHVFTYTFVNPNIYLLFSETANYWCKYVIMDWRSFTRPLFLFCFVFVFCRSLVKLYFKQLKDTIIWINFKRSFASGLSCGERTACCRAGCTLGWGKQRAHINLQLQFLLKTMKPFNLS